MEESLPMIDTDSKHTAVKFLGVRIPINLAIAFWTIISTLTGISMQIFMPLLLFTFGGTAGVYPVVFICALFFNLIFWPIVLYRHFKESRENKVSGIIPKKGFLTRNFTSKLIWIGLYDASNGVLSVFSSSPARVPPVLQPIILQSYMIFTLVFSSWVLGRKYKRQQILSVLVLFLGILISLVPVFTEIAKGEDLAFQNGVYLGNNSLHGKCSCCSDEHQRRASFRRKPNIRCRSFDCLGKLVPIFVHCFWLLD